MSRKLASLLFSAAQLDSRIEREQRRPSPRWVDLLRMKILRMRFKDRIRAAVHGAVRQRRQHLRPAFARH